MLLFFMRIIDVFWCTLFWETIFPCRNTAYIWSALSYVILHRSSWKTHIFVNVLVKCTQPLVWMFVECIRLVYTTWNVLIWGGLFFKSIFNAVYRFVWPDWLLQAESTLFQLYQRMPSSYTWGLRRTLRPLCICFSLTISYADVYIVQFLRFYWLLVIWLNMWDIRPVFIDFPNSGKFVLRQALTNLSVELKNSLS